MQFSDQVVPTNQDERDLNFRRSLEHLSDQLARREAPPPTHVDMLPGDPEEGPAGMHPAIKMLGVALLAVAAVAGINSFRQDQPRPTPVVEARATPPSPPPSAPAVTAPPVAPVSPAPAPSPVDQAPSKQASGPPPAP